MKQQIFQKCCFYYPLESGLLIWGYLNLIRYCTLDGISAVTCTNRLRLHFHSHDPFYEDLTSIAVMFSVTMIVVFSNLVFNIIYVIAMHIKKHTRRLQAYAVYVGIRLILYAIFLIVGHIWGSQDEWIFEWMYRHVDPVTYYLTIEYPAFAVIDIIFQMHHIILIKSHLNNEETRDDTRALEI